MRSRKTRTPPCRPRAEGYVDEILSRQNPDGGWGLAGGGSDVDLTAMALQALAKYRDNSTVSAAVDAGLDWLVWQQEPDGTFASWGTVSSESVCQVLVALTELGISLEDERFYKNHATLEDVLLAFSSGKRQFFPHIGWRQRPDRNDTGALRPRRRTAAAGRQNDAL